jgi:hypothetical protein
MDEPAAAGAIDEALGYLSSPAPAKCLVLRPVAPLLGRSLSSTHLFASI